MKVGHFYDRCPNPRGKRLPILSLFWLGNRHIRVLSRFFGQKRLPVIVGPWSLCVLLIDIRSYITLFLVVFWCSSFLAGTLPTGSSMVNGEGGKETEQSTCRPTSPHRHDEDFDRFSLLTTTSQKRPFFGVYQVLDAHSAPEHFRNPRRFPCDMKKSGRDIQSRE